MKIWTGKICRRLPIVLAVGVLTAACSSTPSETPKPARSDEVDNEVSLKTDRETIAELRKDIPEEVRKSNDRLAESLNRWKSLKTPPDQLRERFDDEIRKMRADIDKRQRRKREDFQRSLSDKRKEFQNKQKEDRDTLFATKPTHDARQAFMDKQSLDRDRFQSDQHDERDDFEDAIKDERKTFEGDISERWTEFRQEYPEYTRVYKEMKDAEDKRKEEEKANPKPYSGWPYKMPGSEQPSADPRTGASPNPSNVDVNKGQDGWPATDSSEFDKMGQ